jgi:hypothetical protein
VANCLDALPNLFAAVLECYRFAFLPRRPVMIAKTPTGNAAHPLADAFRRQNAPQPLMRILRKSSLLVTEFMSDQPNLVLNATLPRDNAYVVTLHLRARPKGAMAAEGRWIQPENFHGGNAGIVDLRMKLESEYAGPFHYISFYLTRDALDSVADDAGSPRIGDLCHRPGVGFSDPVATGAQREGPFGHAQARLMESTAVVETALRHLRARPLVFLCAPAAGCGECDRARASVG